MTTIADVARLGKVSVGTVSNVLNNPDKVKPETRERVFRVIEELNFHPNPSARNLSRLKTETIALIFPFSKRKRIAPYYSDLLAGITEICFQMNFKLLLSSCPPNIGRQEEILIYKKMIDSRVADGIILTVPRYDDERIPLLIDREQKFVVLGRSNLPVEFPWVDIDGKYGISDAVRYLVNLKHKRIGYIGTSNIYMFSRDRLEGYKSGLEHARIDIDPGLIIEARQDGDEVENGENEMIRILSKEDPPSAVVVSGSQLALGAIKGINRFGYSIGKDISLVCFDDAEWIEYFTPPITAIKQPLYEAGKLMTTMLIQRIQGVESQDSHVLLQPELVIRGSCKKNG